MIGNQENGFHRTKSAREKHPNEFGRVQKMGRLSIEIAKYLIGRGVE